MAYIENSKLNLTLKIKRKTYSRIMLKQIMSYQKVCVQKKDEIIKF